jgi:hypothetical protein
MAQSCCSLCFADETFNELFILGKMGVHDQ